MRKSDQSFGLAAITPFINKPNYKGYGDVAPLFVEKSGYSFAYGVSLCCPSPKLEDSEPQQLHITFGDQFDSKVVLYCLIPEVTASDRQSDILVVFLEAETFHQFAFPANPIDPKLPSPELWGISSITDFMSGVSGFDQKSIIIGADFQRVGMFLIEHLKHLKQDARYESIFYPQKQRPSSLDKSTVAVLVDDDLDAQDKLEDLEKGKANVKGTSRKSEAIKLLQEAQRLYDLAPTPRKRGATIRFEDLDTSQETPDEAAYNRPLVADMSVGSTAKTKIPPTAKTKTPRAKKQAKTTEHKEAESKAKEYKKLLDEVTLEAEKAKKTIADLKIAAATDSAQMKVIATTPAQPHAKVRVSASSSNTSFTPSPLTVSEAVDRDGLRAHADADLKMEAKRDEHLFTLLERANKLA
jgi:hypothetical protein